MERTFKNVAPVEVLGIPPQATSVLTVDADGLLPTRYARGLLKSGHLFEVKEKKANVVS